MMFRDELISVEILEIQACILNDTNCSVVASFSSKSAYCRYNIVKV